MALIVQIILIALIALAIFWLFFHNPPSSPL